MSTAPPSIGVITPFKALWRWLVTTPGVPQQVTGPTHQPPTAGICTGSSQRSHILRGQSHVPNPSVVRRPLRMVRVMEAGQTPSQVGRMVISGRMADVCAELDRLAAHEARLH